MQEISAAASEGQVGDDVGDLLRTGDVQVRAAGADSGAHRVGDPSGVGNQPGDRITCPSAVRDGSAVTWAAPIP